MATLLMTILGPDDPTLVHDVSSTVQAHDGTWLDSQISRLGNKMAGLALVDVPDERRVQLEWHLAAMEELQAVVSETDRTALDGETAHVHLVGHSSAAILSQVTSLLSRSGVGLDEISTYVRPAPRGSEPLFHAIATLRLPEGASAQQLKDELTAVADGMEVDLDFVAEHL